MLLLLLLASLAPGRPATDCKEYILNDCEPPQFTYAMNAGSQELCQGHCKLFSWCSFYAYHSSNYQGLDCYLYKYQLSNFPIIMIKLPNLPLNPALSSVAT